MSQRRYELSDEQFALIEPLLPPAHRRPYDAQWHIADRLSVAVKLCSGAPGATCLPVWPLANGLRAVPALP